MMAQDNLGRFRDMLIRHEGRRLKPYKDTVGKLTIGVGRNLDDVGISEQESNLLLFNDIGRVAKEATDTFTWFKSLSQVRQDVILSMLFNMGMNGLQGFHEMLSDIYRGNFAGAAEEMLKSLWAKQVGPRAIELAFMMKNDRYMGQTELEALKHYGR
jgi:lysozyme